jgi:hypothetical protein
MKYLIFIILLIFCTCCPLTGLGSYDIPVPERVYLHTDKASYIAGEYLYYKLYLQGNPGQPGRYAYLLLRDRNNSTVTFIRLDVINQTSEYRFISDSLLYKPDEKCRGDIL